MTIKTEQIVSMTDANQNFSRVARVADSTGAAVIFKNNRPKYVILDINSCAYLDLTDDEKIDVVARRILNRYRPAFEELAK